jgi:hypothetical protein
MKEGIEFHSIRSSVIDEQSTAVAWRSRCGSDQSLGKLIIILLEHGNNVAIYSFSAIEPLREQLLPEYAV